MGSHEKEYAVFYKNKTGKAVKHFTVKKKRKADVDRQAKVYAILQNLEYSHCTQIVKND